MENRKVIILGSSRSDGNSAQVVSEIISKEEGIEVIDLNNYSISYYDYEHKNKDDDFLPLMRHLAENKDTLIFVTPVYWYNMSGIMKVFFDRISDLLTIEKELGRKLRGKNMSVISNSDDESLDYDFYLPFRLSSEYLGMNYLGNMHISNKVT